MSRAWHVAATARYVSIYSNLIRFPLKFILCKKKRFRAILSLRILGERRNTTFHIDEDMGELTTYVQLQILQILRFFVWLRFLANFTIFRQLIAKFAIFHAAL